MGSRDDPIKERLGHLGVDSDRADAVLELDAVLQRWRRKSLKRELGLRAISELGLSLELAQLDALVAVWAPSNEFGHPEEGETTVGLVATRLGIDPSRASRLTSDLIRLGLVRRGVSQEDARRATLEVTEDGGRIVQAIRAFKFLTLGSFLASWEMDEIEQLIALTSRFVDWHSAPADPTGVIAAEIAEIRQDIADLAAKGTNEA